jgi:hypothetical protein
MILLFNAFTLLVCLAWNLLMVLGTIYVIDYYNWSAWTLVATMCFIARWAPYKMVKDEPPKPEEPSKIIL